MGDIEQMFREVHGSLALEGLAPDDFTRSLEAEICARLSISEAIARAEERRPLSAAQSVERLSTVATVFGLTTTELGRLFGARCQGIDYWRRHRVPADVAAAASRVAELARS